MALGEINWLQFKSKSTRERDEREYEAWAFPYGQAHRDAIAAILKELMPKEDEKTALICFLTAKEIISRVYQIMFIDEHKEYAYRSIFSDLKRYKRMFRPSENRSFYCVLAIADLGITSELAYPSVEELKVQAAEFENKMIEIGGY